jgi:hypothetical protein
MMTMYILPPALDTFLENCGAGLAGMHMQTGPAAQSIQFNQLQENIQVGESNSGNH